MTAVSLPALPSSNHLGSEVSPEAIGVAAQRAEEVGFEVIFVLAMD
jgi:hypothetical protein